MNIGLTLLPGFEELYNKFAHDEKLVKYLELDGIAPHHLDIGLLNEEFFNSKLADCNTDSNSNMNDNYSPSTYRTHMQSGQMKLFGYHMLWYYAEKRYGREFADKAISMIWNGGIYFHDAHGVKIQMPYCWAFSLDKLVFDGRPYGSSPNTPPKHRRSFISQIDKLISDLSKQFAGATAPSDFLLWYSYYCKLESLDLNDPATVKDIVNDFQSLVCLFNEPSRAEGESPFVNIGLYDRIGLVSLFDHIMFPNFEKPDYEYIMQLQRIFAEWFAEGDPLTGFPYRFPVVTMNLTTDDHNDFADKETAEWFSKVNRTKANFNVHFGDKAKLAMCCRYENDLNDMGVSPDSFGNGGVNIGSHRVVTPNIARIAKSAMDECGVHYAEEVFYERLDEVLDVCHKLLIVHRYDILKKRINRNPDYLMFFGRLKWFSLDSMFSTFGITGINEVCEYMGYDITSDDGTDFALDMLSHIKKYTRDLKKQYGVSFNMEEIPGEQACVTIASKDRLFFEDDTLTKLYSNQYIPLTKPVDIFTRLELAGRFMGVVSGGGIVHVNVESQLDTDEKMYEVMKYAAKCGVNHMAICHRFGKCVNGHTNIVGTHGNKCPECGEEIYWTRCRVIGYYSDEQNWHKVRREIDAPNRFYSEV